MIKSIIIYLITIIVLLVMITNILYKIVKCRNDRREIVVQGEIVEDV